MNAIGTSSALNSRLATVDDAHLLASKYKNRHRRHSYDDYNNNAISFEAPPIAPPAISSRSSSSSKAKRRMRSEKIDLQPLTVQDGAGRVAPAANFTTPAPVLPNPATDAKKQQKNRRHSTSDGGINHIIGNFDKNSARSASTSSRHRNSSTDSSSNNGTSNLRHLAMLQAAVLRYQKYRSEKFDQKLARNQQKFDHQSTKIESNLNRLISYYERILADQQKLKDVYKLLRSMELEMERERFIADLYGSMVCDRFLKALQSEDELETLV